MTVRLWVDDKDYGAVSERAAEMFVSIHKDRYPEQSVLVEVVADDAPTFLPGEEVQDA